MVPIILFAISGLVHFIYFGRPSSVVFDEVFYGNFTSQYWQGLYFFDLHPPFVKILFAFVGKFFGLDQYIVDWTSIGNSLPISIVALRILPTIAGLLLPLVIYAICRKFDFSKTSAFVAGALICLENSLVVQSRYLLPDVIMVLFGFSAIYFYLEYRSRLMMPKSSWFFALSTLCAGIALSIKWTGLTFVFIILVLELLRIYFELPPLKILIKKVLIFSAKYLIISAFIYVSLFAIHFSILSHSGPGDAFMTAGFQSTLTGNSIGQSNVEKPNFWQKITELNRVMYTSSAGLTATHPNSSKWYTWPIMQRAIFYWQDQPSPDGTNSYIYLLGNPFIYWLGTLVIALTIIYTIYKLIIRWSVTTDPDKAIILVFLSLGYLANLLPFALIGRVMFLYHYETALVISIIAIVFWLDALQPNHKKYVSIVIFVIALAGFIFWSPLTYGIPITPHELDIRIWMVGWR